MVASNKSASPKVSIRAFVTEIKLNWLVISGNNNIISEAGDAGCGVD